MAQQAERPATWTVVVDPQELGLPQKRMGQMPGKFWGEGHEKGPNKPGFLFVGGFFRIEPCHHHHLGFFRPLDKFFSLMPAEQEEGPGGGQLFGEARTAWPRRETSWTFSTSSPNFQSPGCAPRE